MSFGPATTGARHYFRAATLLILATTLASCSHLGSGVFPASNSYLAGTSAALRAHERADATYRILFSFGRSVYGLYGAVPEAGLVPVHGMLYGTTAFGGAYQCGTVFGISPAGVESVLHSFNCGSDGAYPAASVLNVNGWLYGTTGGDAVYGSSGFGTVFRIKLTGSGFRVVHAFTGSDGANPLSVLASLNGNLYGTTYAGGAYGNGTVFSLRTSDGQERVLHSFTGKSDGGGPLGSLTFLGGRFYGTTEFGGTSSGGGGTVFRMTTGGRETVLHSFSGADGLDPVAAVIAIGKSLFGTTLQGGEYNGGTVFRIKTDGKERVVHSFGKGTDGFNPKAALLSVDGVLYGTTSGGGTGSAGIIFQLTTTGKERVLHNFTAGYKNDGFYSTSSLVRFNGTIYGTTQFGGLSLPSCSRSEGCDYGTVFALKPPP